MPKKTYELDFGMICPETIYLFLLSILCVVIIIIDIVISMLPWVVEFISFKRITQFLRNVTRKPNIHNSTAKSSVTSNNEESFKKEKTLVLVSPLNNEDDLLRVNHTKLCIKELPIEMINDNKDENENNKDTDRPINLILNSERGKLKNNLMNKTNDNISLSNSINFLKGNKNMKETKIINDFEIIQNKNNIAIENKFDEDKKNK